jgi:hypothetical protein
VVGGLQFWDLGAYVWELPDTPPRPQVLATKECLRVVVRRPILIPHAGKLNQPIPVFAFFEVDVPTGTEGCTTTGRPAHASV